MKYKKGDKVIFKAQPKKVYSKDYDYIEEYDVQAVQIWEDDQIAFTFGPCEWDICSIKETDLIKIK